LNKYEGVLLPCGENGGGVAGEQVCYYTMVRNEHGVDHVRFGACLRVEAQIHARPETWLRLAQVLVEKGCRLVEIEGSGGETARVDGAEN
jgi:hypothetical protein